MVEQVLAMTCATVQLPGVGTAIVCGSFPAPKPLFFKRTSSTSWKAEDLIIARVRVYDVVSFELRRDDKTPAGHWIGRFETVKQARAAAEQCRAA
jgi:hypothetical protein